MLSILLPTDFSENSINAIKYALEFFKYQKTDFYFMNAYRSEFYDDEILRSPETYDTDHKKVEDESKHNMRQLVNDIKAFCPNSRFTYHSHSAFNTLVGEANQFVETHNIDLIVMGTKGKSDDRNIVFGSQTFQVLKYVQCPVLAIPSNYTNAQPKRILFPTDYQIPYKRRELKLLSVLAKSYRSAIDILYVSKGNGLSLRQQDNQKFIKEALDGNTFKIIQESHKSIAEAIKFHIKQNNIDLLTMVNTQHSFLEDMVFPSTLDKVSLELKIPLLAMQNTRRY